jgi:AcrR family transcriptional regulator
VGYRHSQEDILAAAAAVALDTGMGGLTFAKVGERLGISDRTVVYYYPSKSDLIVAVALALGGDLERLLGAAFGDAPRTPAELLQRAWPVLTTPEADSVFALYFEMVGLASAGHPPFVELGASMVGGWVEWLASRTKGSTPAIRRQRATAVVAQIDGLLLVRRLVGAEAAESAAIELGIRR